MLGVPRSLVADAGLPTERLPVDFAATDIEGAVDNHVELEPGTGSELENPHTPLGTIVESQQTNTGHLLQIADPAEKLVLPK